MTTESFVIEKDQRPSTRLVIGGLAVLLVAAAAATSNHYGNVRQQKQFADDQVNYDVAEDVIGREMVTIPWESNNPDVPGAIDSVRKFGNSIGETLVTDKRVYITPTNDSTGFWAVRPQIDFDRTKTAVENTAEYLKTSEGDGRDQFARYHVILSAVSGGHLGNKDTKGEALLRLQDELEKPAGVYRSATMQSTP